MKKIFSIITVLVLIFSINTNVLASDTPVTDNIKVIGNLIEDFKSANQYTWTQINDFIDTMSRYVGLPKKGHSSGGHAFDPEIVHHIAPDVDPTDPDAVGDWIGNQITIQDNDNISVTNDFRQMFNDFNDDLGKVYCYTYDILESTGCFSYTNTYIAVRDLIPPPTIAYTEQKIYLSTAVHVGLSNSNYVFVFDLKAHPYLYCKPYLQSSPVDNVKVYDGLTNQPLVADAIYRWNTTLKDWESVTANDTSAGISLDKNDVGRDAQSGQYNFIFNKGYTTQLRYFPWGTTPTAEDIIYQPYYYNNDVWQDFSTSSGDYTLSNDNINYVTYGDITGYINSFNNENGFPPTTQDINIEITVKNDDSKPSGDSGGSGGSGSDDDDDGGSIFDWLKNLGKVLGDLIKGVGEFITEIIAGLVSALNDLMSSLSGLITDTLGSLTTVFSSIIDFVYSGLPDSVKGIMMLALTVSLLITVIQLIRK